MNPIAVNKIQQIITREQINNYQFLSLFANILHGCMLNLKFIFYLFAYEYKHFYLATYWYTKLVFNR
jgi:hypothetical protein